MIKAKLIFVYLSVFISIMGAAQENSSGVYLSYEDYQNKKLSYSAGCEGKNRIKLNEAFNSSYITLKREDKKIKLDKDSIYAVSICDKPLMRFQNREPFYLEEKGAIWIFYKTEHIHNEKSTEIVKSYYFCVNGNERLRPLTLTNIKIAFPNKEKFHDLLDDQFKAEDASVYDAFHKMFKINHLLKFSLN